MAIKPLAPEENLVLIGMPGAGKSTVGVLLAKVLSRPFLDTDLVIQSQEGRRLRHIIEEQGRDTFCALEEAYVVSLDYHGYVIATGGSVVYSVAAMEHLKRHGRVVYLDLPLEPWLQRIKNPTGRGVVMGQGQTLTELYAERLPLYQCHADVIVDCTGLDHEGVVEAVIEAVGLRI